MITIIVISLVIMASNFMSSIEEKHEINRTKVCIICYRKGNRQLSESAAEGVRRFVIEDFDINNSNFPSGICNGCHLLLSKKCNGEDVSLPVSEEYDPQRPKSMRSLTHCTCRICEVGEAKLMKAVKMKKKAGRPCNPESGTMENRETIKICGHCFTKLYPGCQHSSEMCSSRRSKVSNIEKLINSPVSTQRLSSRWAIPGTSLATLGSKPKPIPAVTPEKSVPSSISASDMSHMQQQLNLSTRKTHMLATNIRQATGSQKSLEGGLKKSLYEIHHQLDNNFQLVRVPYITEDNNKFDEWSVVVKDLEQFIEFVIEHRGLSSESALIKVGIDGGGGFLKICLSIFDMSLTADASHRALFKDSGVKKCFIIGIAPISYESYINVKSLWTQAGVHLLKKKFSIASDLKLCNILLGLMPHTSMHPCSWCDVNRYNLHKKGNNRTIASLRDKYWNFEQAGVDRNKAKEFGNVVNYPIVNVDEANTLVLSIIPPPELHLLTGTVTTIFNSMKKLWPESDKWLKESQVLMEAMHGGCFTGNDARKLLNNVKKLDELNPPDSCIPYFNAFESFSKVVHSCFGSDLLPDFSTKIDEFYTSYLNLGISVTPKVHAVMHHIKDFCNNTGKGLGPWSEQTSESVHHDFCQTWEKYKIRRSDHPNYGKKLLDAVRFYNSQHL